MTRFFAALSPIVLASAAQHAQADQAANPQLGPAMEVSLPGLDDVHRLGLAVADVDNDGRRDVVAAVAGRMSTSLNGGADGFAPFVQHQLTATGFLPGT